MKSTRRILQARYNAEAVMEFYGLPPLVSVCDCADRSFFLKRPGFLEALSGLPFASWNFLQAHGTSAVRGWRENEWRCSMQIVEHCTGLLEVDFDLWNPDQGLLPAFCHGVECLWPGKTDSLKVRNGLIRRGITPVKA